MLKPDELWADRFGKPFPIHDLEDEDILHWAKYPSFLANNPRLQLEVERRGLTVQSQ
jgi:hypothetical protein